MSGCQAEGCDLPHHSRGMCNKHSKRIKLTGRIDLISMQERFWAKVDKSGECWLWTGSVSGDGYGRFRSKGESRGAHRISWELSNGPIPGGMEIDHKCWTPSCVNPHHLQVVTRKLNNENSAGPRRGNPSGIRGVSRHPKTRKWYVRIFTGGKNISGGYFTDLREAEKAAIELRNQYFTNNLSDRKAA